MALLMGVCPPYARALAVGAHPDDIELGAGGLLARLVRSGTRVVMAVCSVPSQVEQRLAEARKGAELIGAHLVTVLGVEPVRVEDARMHRLVASLDEVVNQLKPELVVTHSLHDVHWDHKLVHYATVAALRRTPCDLLAFVSTPELNAQSHFRGQCFADITETMDVKLQAVGAHVTQIEKESADVESCRDIARALGRIAGVRYAEAYEVLRLRL